jgi:uncharacterized membrane protein HdeD (DUF308 family)
VEELVARNWGWMALRGVAALVFGLLTLWNPGITLAVLVLLFGAFALVDGIFAVVASLTNRREEAHWVAMLVGGLAGMVIGICTFIAPGVAATVLLFVIAAWALITGIAQIAAAIQLRKVIRGEWLLALAGVLSVALGLLLVSRPALGALAVVLWIGAYALAAGVVLIGLALRLRAWGREHHTPATPAL